MEKAKNIISKCAKSKRLGIGICIVIFVISCIYLVADIGYTELFYYPEEEYQLLEDEARLILEKNDLETEYELEITSYNNKTNELSFDLKTKNATVSISVNNYLKDNQVITVERGSDSQLHQIAGNIIAIVVISAMFACIIYVIVLVVLGIIYVLLIILSFILKVLLRIASKNKEEIKKK